MSDDPVDGDPVEGDPVEGDPVERLASRIADGEEIDWSHEQTSVDPALAGALRDLEKLATAHRRLHEDEEPRPAPAAVLQPGDRWGRLEILEVLGSGGFADVYRARDTSIHRDVALKLLRAPEDDGAEQLREARLLARLKHPNVVTVYGADRHDGRVGLWMELLEGKNLFEVVDEDGPLSAREAVLVGMDLCRALAAVHESGIVHRDVKAQNVIRERGGRIVLMDFGIGVDVEGGGRGAGPTGTPAYLAPELLVGGEASERSDVYALGVLLFFLVTGEFPVRGSSLEELREAHDARRPRLLRDLRSDLPEPFLRALEQALSADAGERFATAGAFQRRLAEILVHTADPSGVLDRPRPLRQLLGAAALLVIAAVLVALFALPRLRPPPEPRTVLLAGIDDRTGDERFHGLLGPALRAAVGASPAFDPVPRSEVEAVLERMLVAGAGKPAPLTLGDDLARDAAARLGAAGILRGETFTRSGDGSAEPAYEIRLQLASAEEGGPQRVVVVPVEATGAVSVDRALQSALAELAEVAPLLGAAPALEPVTTDSQEALVIFSRALAAYRDGEVEAACTGFDRALGLDPELALAHYWAGMCHAARGQAEAALRFVRRGWELRRRTATELERYLLVGGYRAATRQYGPAIDAYRKVIELRPGESVAPRQLAIAYVALGQLDEALVYAHEGRYAGTLVNHGYLVYTLALAGRFHDALEEVEAARARFGDEPYLRWGEGLALLGLDRFDEALATFRALGVAKSGTYRNFATWLEAQAWIYAGERRRALDLLHQGERHDAARGTQYFQARRACWRAETLRLEGREAAAADALVTVEALPSLPSHLTMFRSAAVLLVRLGELERARALLRRLEEILETYPGRVAERVVYQVRGELQAAEGRLDEASAVLARGEPLADVSYLASMARHDVRRGDCVSAAETDRRLLARKGEILGDDYAGLWHEALARREACRP